MARKHRIFLGAYVNYTNAQNLNCLALARHLDKSKYEVRTIIGYSGNLPVEQISGVRYYKMRYPAKIWMPLAFLRGILWCDLAYLPVPGCWKLCRWVLRTFHKKAFKTVEGVFQGVALDRALALESTVEGVKASLEYTGHTYAITKSMIAPNERLIGVHCSSQVLYLGVDPERFRVERIVSERLSDVLLVGADLERKGGADFLDLAKRFPSIVFHIVGGAVGNFKPMDEVAKRGVANVVYHGTLSHAQLREVLAKVQLHVFPSRAEGFPKVTLECAAAGVPSLVYGDYGADEWITTGQDGFVVNTQEEMAEVIADLVGHPEKLPVLVDGARALAQRFDWKVLVKDWESVIDAILAE